MIRLLQTKTTGIAHTGIFASVTFLDFSGGAWGRSYGCRNGVVSFRLIPFRLISFRLKSKKSFFFLQFLVPLTVLVSPRGIKG